MDRLSSVVKSHFRRHWRTISSQIEAVTDASNPKRGFLFDCGLPDVDKLVKIVRILKKEGLVAMEVKVAVAKEDIFILNTRKFIQNSTGSGPVIIDVSGSLKVPEKVTSGSFALVFDGIKAQLNNDTETDVVTLKINDDWCVCTIFGYLIGYPSLYYLRPDQENNNLSFVDLLVFQVLTAAGVLISFSIPKAIHERDPGARDSIEHFLNHYRNSSNHEIKIFSATHPVVNL